LSTTRLDVQYCRSGTEDEYSVPIVRVPNGSLEDTKWTIKDGAGRAPRATADTSPHTGVAPAASLLLMLLMLPLAYTEQAGNRTPEPLTQFFSVFSKFFENLFFGI